MKTIMTFAAIAAFWAMAGNASAANYSLSPDEIEVCRTLEMAHESSCAEYGAKLAADSADMTGSVAPATASYIPYVNGAGDPDGLTRSNRQFPVTTGIGR